MSFGQGAGCAQSKVYANFILKFIYLEFQILRAKFKPTDRFSKLDNHVKFNYIVISMKCLASQEGHLEEELTFINDACLAAVSSQQ
jgi:hypothetical protein